MQWRNWRLLVKLGAVLMVPAVLAVGLGVVQIRGDVKQANSFSDMQHLVKMRSELRTLLDTLQMERTMSVERLGDSVHLEPSDLRMQTSRVDSARKAVTSTRNREVSLHGVAANRYRDAAHLLTRLPALRAQVASGHIASWTALSDYSTIITGVLNLDQALFSPFSVPQLSRSATTLYDLEAIVEQVHLQHVIVLQAASPGHSMTPALLRDLQESDIRMRDGLGDFRTVAAPEELKDYQRTVTGPSVDWRERTVNKALAMTPGAAAQQVGTTSLPLQVEKWNHASEDTGMLLDKVGDDLTRSLRTTSAQLQDQASDRAGMASVLVFAVLLLAFAIGLAIGRHLLRSLTVLRTTALDVAEHRLPAAVMSMREGQTTNAEVDVVPVHTTEEFGQLARAFDTVHSQAVRLAAEQAGLRGDLRNTLVNLSRRSQSLVDRLLLLMEQLERREEDPDQLASLFTLDHLATRMRRNNENMMVLCGSTLLRSSRQRVSLDTVLRSSVSEIERYQRVLVHPTPPVDVTGYAAGDLGRLVAELLDNATAFSPPHTQVVIGGGWEHDGSVLLEIQDEGIGMSESDLAMANQRVATPGSADAPASRQLGLLVVGRLATRHGITVRFSSPPGRSGVRAEVRISATLVKTQAQSPTDRQGPMAERPLTGRIPGQANGDRLKRPHGSSASRTLPGDRGPAADRPAAGPAARRPAGRAAQQSGGENDLTQAGLPRRPSSAQSGPQVRAERPAASQGRAERPPTREGTAPGLAAGRAHSFLSSYQAGLRRARPDQTQNPSATGREKP
ncbi:hypothetical protein Sm713_11320 [Streptomyces sp. TS71-3]|nr:hypothetical protein Sm713_11320 [Streptomyces sp. TS71-3]